MNVFERFIENHPEIQWDWNTINLINNPSITPMFFERHPEIPKNMFGLSHNPYLTNDFIERHLDWKWDRYY